MVEMVHLHLIDARFEASVMVLGAKRCRSFHTEKQPRQGACISIAVADQTKLSLKLTTVMDDR